MTGATNSPEFAEALSALRAGRPADAARLFDAVLRADPKHIGALNLMAVVLINSRRFAEAENYLRRALQHHPQSDATLSNYGTVLKALNRPAEALRSFDDALEINSSVPDTWNHRGTVLNDLQRYEDAIIDFDKAIALNPRYAAAFYNKGKSFLALKRADEALAAFERRWQLVRILPKRGSVAALRSSGATSTQQPWKHLTGQSRRSVIWSRHGLAAGTSFWLCNAAKMRCRHMTLRSP